MRWLAGRILGAIITATVVLPAFAVADDGAYTRSMEQWRENRESSLLAEDGYLAVAGLFWLEEGDNSFGTDPANDFVLPEGSAPARVGVFRHQAGMTRVIVDPGIDEVTKAGEVVRDAELRPSRVGPADAIRLRDLFFHVHVSGDRYGIRLRDLNSPYRKNFVGLRWYPVDADYRVVADFVPFETEKTVELVNIVGGTQTYVAPGFVTMELKGDKIRFDPVMRGDKLFFIFSDATSGRTTYPAARFLYADMPKDGKVIVDFNQAINPACAYSPYTVCPYPPRQNRLTMAIEAGAMKYLGRVDY